MQATSRVLSTVFFCTSVLCYCSFSSAANFNQSNYSGANSHAMTYQANIRSPYSAFINKSNTRLILDGSDTASHYYKVGVLQFERNQLDKAEYSFKAVLRANGLDKQAHYYLAKIYKDQGKVDLAVKHALALKALY